MTLLIILGGLAAAALYLITIYNTLVRLRNLAREGASGIEVQLKRRADLVPNLIETVKGYAAHEKGIFEDVAAKRAETLAARGPVATAAAGEALSGALGRLMAVAEAYPELKADANFRELQQQLAETEDQVQGARRYYNATVRDLNSSIQSFPNVLIARPAGFTEEPYLDFDDKTIAEPPRVDFGTKA